MEHKNETYDSTYVFSADQQEEVKKIYQKYSHRNGRKTLSGEEEKMERLRKLDRSVSRAGTVAALLNGTLGAVIHGIGTVLVQDGTMFTLGTVIAFAGLLLFLVSYPVYCIAAKKRRCKVESQILALCRELMK